MKILAMSSKKKKIDAENSMQGSRSKNRQEGPYGHGRNASHRLMRENSVLIWNKMFQRTIQAKAEISIRHLGFIIFEL